MLEFPISILDATEGYVKRSWMFMGSGSFASTQCSVCTHTRRESNKVTPKVKLAALKNMADVSSEPYFIFTHLIFMVF